LGDKILQYQEMIKTEKEEREETHNTMFKMLEDMHTDLQQ
jgi:hypothetical protein